MSGRPIKSGPSSLTALIVLGGSLFRRCRRENSLSFTQDSLLICTSTPFTRARVLTNACSLVSLIERWPYNSRLLTPVNIVEQDESNSYSSPLQSRWLNHRLLTFLRKKVRLVRTNRFSLRCRRGIIVFYQLRLLSTMLYGKLPHEYSVSLCILSSRVEARIYTALDKLKG